MQVFWKKIHRKWVNFGFLFNFLRVHADYFPFDLEPNGIPVGPKTKGNIQIQLHLISLILHLCPYTWKIIIKSSFEWRNVSMIQRNIFFQLKTKFNFDSMNHVLKQHWFNLNICIYDTKIYSDLAKNQSVSVLTVRSFSSMCELHLVEYL